MSIKPGITGMWQASGRSDITDFEEVVRLDTQYIENWSIGLDLRILLKTVTSVLKSEGCLIEGRESKSGFGKLKAHYDVFKLWKNALKNMKKDDWLYIQFPLVEHTMLFSILIKNLEKRGIHTSIVIHDVEAIRFSLRNDVPYVQKFRMKCEEVSAFKNSSKVIVHNKRMKVFMHEKLKINRDKMVSLEKNGIINKKDNGNI